MSNLEQYLAKTVSCSCGRDHFVPVQKLSCDLWTDDLSDTLAALLHGKRAIMLCDAHTHTAINAPLSDYLTQNGWSLTVREYQRDDLVNDESVVGTAVLDITQEMTGVIAVGGGTITDLGRFVASRLNKPFALVMTCPSMDGYASNVAGMVIGGKKRVLKDCEYPAAVFGDMEVIRNAPIELIRSGYGDMLGKRTALPDWILAHHAHGDYFCPRIAERVAQFSSWCADSDAVAALLNRDKDRVLTLTEALLQTGINMALCNDTRPASGSEHIFSHYLVERAIGNGQKPPSHGASVGFGTLVSTLLYEYLLTVVAPKELVSLEPELLSSLIPSQIVYQLLEQSGIGGKLTDYLPDGQALADMIRASSGSNKRYTILAYLQEHSLLDSAIDYVCRNMK